MYCFVLHLIFSIPLITNTGNGFVVCIYMYYILELKNACGKVYYFGLYIHVYKNVSE